MSIRVVINNGDSQEIFFDVLAVSFIFKNEKNADISVYSLKSLVSNKLSFLDFRHRFHPHSSHENLKDMTKKRITVRTY